MKRFTEYLRQDEELVISLIGIISLFFFLTLKSLRFIFLQNIKRR